MSADFCRYSGTSLAIWGKPRMACTRTCDDKKADQNLVSTIGKTR